MADRQLFMIWFEMSEKLNFYFWTCPSGLFGHRKKSMLT